METLTQAQIPYKRIILFGGIAGAIGGTIGAVAGKNKVVTGILGFVILGGIGAFIAYQTSKTSGGSNDIHL